MKTFLFKFEVGPTAADCHQISINGTDSLSAYEAFWVWLNSAHPHYTGRTMITSQEEIPYGVLHFCGLKGAYE